VYSGQDNVPNTFLTCRFTPALIASPIPFVDIVSGSAICGIDADRAAHCWGADADGSGQLGIPATGNCDGVPCLASPGPSVPGLRFSQLSSGSGTSCGVTESGAGYCWGANSSGQRGAPVSAGSTPNVISGGYEFSGVWIFRDHACGVIVGGDGYCWGLNNVGQLGQPATAISATPTPQKIPGSLKFVSLSPGLNFTCGLTVDGTAHCWGDNPSGQLGDGTTLSRSSPAPVEGGHRFTQLISGRQTVCGLTPEGRVYCWGDNRFGGLGNGDSGTELFGNYFSTTPVGVGGLQ
jgi:alpha-tubulin suppressor-like RCC1 family protein